jgi:hypothetical protein
MIRCKSLMIALSLGSIFALAPLSAMAEQQTNKGKAQAITPKGPAGAGRPAMGAGRSMNAPGQHGMGAPGRAAGRAAGKAAGRGPHFSHDRNHWGDRERHAWAGGHWHPYGCRFGRCGYWWNADGYWYFYDHQMEGPPDVVSDVEFADPSMAGEPPPPPDAVPVAVPPPVVIQRPPVCVGPVCL